MSLFTTLLIFYGILFASALIPFAINVLIGTPVKNVAKSTPSLPSPSEGVVQMTASGLRAAFLLYSCIPIIEIDGEPYRAGWRKPYFFTLTPRTHTIKIFFRYLWITQCGANASEVNVEAGRVVKIDYYMPAWIFESFKVKCARCGKVQEFSEAVRADGLLYCSAHLPPSYDKLPRW